MNEETAIKIIRPTKKQRELLAFIADFISQHGYSPSYREIMNGCNYTSVSTVALHISNLIKRGHLKKRDRSARSLEVVGVVEDNGVTVSRLNETEEKWLVLRVEQFFKSVETTTVVDSDRLDELYVLIGTLKILGLDGAAYSYVRRLNELKKKLETSRYSV